MDSITPSYATTPQASETTDQQTKIQMVVQTLRTLPEADEQEQRETFEYLKQVLDENCPSNRRLFL